MDELASALMCPFKLRYSKNLREHGFAYVFISHDIAVVRYMSERIKGG